MPVTGEDITKAIDAVLTFAERKKTEKKIQSAIADAQKKGHKVEYKIDPATGQTTPIITSGTGSEQYDEMFKTMMSTGQYEVGGMTAGGKPKLTKKKKYKPEDLVQAKMLLQYGADRPVDMKIGQQDVRLDMNKPEDIDKGMSLAYGEDWKNDPELIEAGMPQLYDERMKTLKEKQVQTATPEQPIHPFATGVGRMFAGDYYKDAAAKYGEQKTAQIVDVAMKLQKQGKTYKDIAGMLQEAGVDPNLILGAYTKNVQSVR